MFCALISGNDSQHSDASLSRNPKKWQDLFDQGVHRVLWQSPDEYDSEKNALIYYVSVEEKFFISHGWFYTTYEHHSEIDKDVRSWINFGWLRYHPHNVEYIIDGQEIQQYRYSNVEKFEEDGVEYQLHEWIWYSIFEPGELAIGDHEYNVVYTGSWGYWDTTKEKWVRTGFITFTAYEDWYNYGQTYGLPWWGLDL
ncbi:MAG: hypothetical protein ACFFC7_07750 [Candidatus Hermodarchaeota archaeon]